MNNQIVDQLDDVVTQMLAGNIAAQPGDFQLRELTALVDDLRYLPRPAFRARLHAELISSAVLRRIPVREPVPRHPNQDKPAACETQRSPLASPAALERFMPSFATLAASPIKPSHLALSFALHVAVLATVLTSGVWIVRSTGIPAHVVSLLNDTPLILSSEGREAHGGGGGGDRDLLSASKGTPPRFANEQLKSPAVVVRNEAPKLPATPTVIGPPEIVLPSSTLSGDPLANVLSPPSNGTGSGGGIGSGTDGGVGSGYGPGVGPGHAGGIGGGVFHVGGGVTAPRALYQPDPEYSEEARRAKFQGVVVLNVVIGPDGRPRDLRVARSLGMGLDEKAIEAVRQWKFAPATKDGHPVAVQVGIEVAFRLY